MHAQRWLKDFSGATNMKGWQNLCQTRELSITFNPRFTFSSPTLLCFRWLLLIWLRPATTIERKHKHFLDLFCVVITYRRPCKIVTANHPRRMLQLPFTTNTWNKLIKCKNVKLGFLLGPITNRVEWLLRVGRAGIVPLLSILKTVSSLIKISIWR